MSLQEVNEVSPPAFCPHRPRTRRKPFTPPPGGTHAHTHTPPPRARSHPHPHRAQVAVTISDMVSEDANIIFGTSVDDSFGDEISVTLVATSLPGVEKQPELEVVPEYKVVPSPLHNGHNGHHLNGAHKNGAYKAR